MGRIDHRLVGYTAGAVGFILLGLGVEKQADTLPFASRVHSIPLPEKTELYDQVLKGGNRVDDRHRCAVKMRILLHSEQPLGSLQRYFAQHPVPAAFKDISTELVVGEVHAIAQMDDLPRDWDKWRDDRTVYVADFISPGNATGNDGCPTL